MEKPTRRLNVDADQQEVNFIAQSVKEVYEGHA